jgi:hypothetical protein
MRRRLPLDAILIGLVLFALAYQLFGNLLHEIAGTAFLVLAVVHNLLGRRWYGGLRKGRMRPRRAVWTVVNLVLLATAVLLVVSGLANSHDLFPFFGFAAPFLDYRIHALAAWWLLVLASLHLGLHWPAVAAEIRRLTGLPGQGRLIGPMSRAGAAILVGLGVYAAFERNLPFKLAGLYAFDDWDFDSSIVGFFIFYIAIISLGIFIMRLVMRLMRSGPKGGG